MKDIETSAGTPVSEVLLHNYFKSLVNQFFKILPMKEDREEFLQSYIESFQRELLGGLELIPGFKENSLFFTLVSILQYFIDHPECKTSVVKQEVFRAISICNKLKANYSGRGEPSVKKEVPRT